ncbi:MAG TPA: hypothetical protein VI432_02800 [Candidatus Paceibacterota bacterium]
MDRKAIDFFEEIINDAEPIVDLSEQPDKNWIVKVKDYVLSLIGGLNISRDKAKKSLRSEDEGNNDERAESVDSKVASESSMDLNKSDAGKESREEENIDNKEEGGN